MSSINSNFFDYSNIKIDNNQAQLSNLQKTFWGLGKDAIWMQVFDGKFHKFGKDVFDKGLHGREIEPGYLDSVMKACEYASENLGKELNIDFYKELHRKACSHFTRFQPGEIHRVTTSLFAGEKIQNLFINDEDYEVFCTFLKYKNYSLVKEYLSEKEKIPPEDQKEIELSINNGLKILNITIDEISQTTEDETWMENNKNWINQYESRCEEKLSKLRDAILEVSNFLDTEEPIVDVGLRDGLVALIYEAENYSGYKYEHQVDKVIQEYNKNIKEAKTDDQKLSSIASLFQKLEWIHPFPDGQGRTDIVLLSKLLVENGFTPPILQELFVSSLNNLEDWTEYLKKGIENWKKVQKDIGKT